LLCLPLVGHTSLASTTITNPSLLRFAAAFPAESLAGNCAAMTKKELIIVGGPNGAGKSTYVAGFLEKRSCSYLCADLIASEFQHLDPISQQIAAGREFLRRIERQLLLHDDFVIETTLSGRTLRNFLTRAQTSGFSVTITFIYLDSASTSVGRVTERVRRGGHDVPEADIRRRFSRSLSNFWHVYRKIADQWAIIYNAGSGPVEVAFGYRDEFAISDDGLFHRFLELAEAQFNG
jgi:predicted ABC-type ATPase